MGLGKPVQAIAATRKKEEVLLQLPERMDKTFFVPMTKEQWIYHEDNRQIVARIVQKWRRYKFLSGADQRRLTLALQNMRIFLSTEAGGVGLNLQRASVVINMDLPWNPAVLDQRIGRVHRIGQHRPVRVVNFVSEGTIEHGMLSILDFKRSLFAGVLDGNEDSVFVGETRLNRFMRMVEETTQAIPETAHDPPPPVIPSSEEMEVVEEELERQEAPEPAPISPLQPLFVSAVSFLKSLGNLATAVGRSGKNRSHSGNIYLLHIGKTNRRTHQRILFHNSLTNFQ
ncbi:MAG: helicase-related protein [Acidobacteriota bacterium]